VATTTITTPGKGNSTKTATWTVTSVDVYAISSVTGDRIDLGSYTTNGSNETATVKSTNGASFANTVGSADWILTGSSFTLTYAQLQSYGFIASATKVLTIYADVNLSNLANQTWSYDGTVNLDYTVHTPEAVSISMLGVGAMALMARRRR